MGAGESDNLRELTVATFLEAAGIHSLDEDVLR